MYKLTCLRHGCDVGRNSLLIGCHGAMSPEKLNFSNFIRIAPDAPFTPPDMKSCVIAPFTLIYYVDLLLNSRQTLLVWTPLEAVYPVNACLQLVATHLKRCLGSLRCSLQCKTYAFTEWTFWPHTLQEYIFHSKTHWGYKHNKHEQHAQLTRGFSK